MAFEYPSEVIDIPSRGWFYPKESPLATGQIEIYYMTARHEDILTSANLIQKGVVFDKLLEALIVNKDIKIGQLLSGDKDAILLASRIMGYGKEYTVTVDCPSCGNKNDVDINLQDIEAKKVEVDESYRYKNEFPFHCSVSKAEVTFKLMNHQDDKIVDHEIEIVGKGQAIKKEVTTRLAHAVTSINGNTEKKFITDYIEILPARDSMQLREFIKKTNPGMDMNFDFECEKCNHQSRIEVPMTVNFFGLTSEYKKQLHKTLFQMVTYGKGGWNWADLYAMPVFLRNFYLHELVLAVKKENDANSTPQGVPSHSFPKGPAIMRK